MREVSIYKGIVNYLQKGVLMKKSYSIGAYRYVWLAASIPEVVKTMKDNDWRVVYSGESSILFEKARVRS